MITENYPQNFHHTEMPIKINILFTILLTVLLSTAADCITYIGQNIDKDSKWLKSGSPYIITIDLSVNKGATLEIEAGTEIYFSMETRMTVSGNLIAIGSKSKRISFSGLNESEWGGFLFTRDCNDYDPATKEGVSFVYCNFRGTGESPSHLIKSKGCNINMSHCNITDCYTAIQTERQAEVLIRESVFRNCNRVINVKNTSLATVEGNRMYGCNSIMLGGTTTFRNNILKKFTGNGRHSGLIVWMSGGGIVDISDNQFIKFEDYAIKLQKATKRSSFLVHNNNFKNNGSNLKLSCKYFNKGKSVIEHNNFYNYRKYHVRLFSPCTEKAAETLKIGSNYWGRLSGAEVKSATLDRKQDDKISAEVEYGDVLNKAY
jgi:hypothetical protein